MSSLERALSALPARPSIEQLKKRARELLLSIRAGDAQAEARVRAAHPRFTAATDFAALRLADAQLVIARESGASSWPDLKARIEDKRRLTSLGSRPGPELILELGPLVFCPFSTRIVHLHEPRALAAVATARARDAVLVAVFQPSPRNGAPSERRSVAALARIGAVRQGPRDATSVSLTWLARARVERQFIADDLPQAEARVESEPTLAPADAKRAARRIAAGLARLARTVEWISAAEVREFAEAGELERLLARAAEHCPELVVDLAERSCERVAVLERIAQALEQRADELASGPADGAPSERSLLDPHAPAYLVVLGARRHPHLIGRRFALAKPRTDIGRGEHNDVVVHSQAISREHARIEREGDDFVLSDLDSTNGTALKGSNAKVSRERLRDGDQIELGDTVLGFVGGEDLDAKCRAAVEYAAEHDVLTETRRHQAWLGDCERSIVRARAAGEPFSILLVALDAYSALEAEQGELCAERAVAALARDLRAAGAPASALGRAGRERILVALPGLALDAARELGERARAQVASRASVEIEEVPSLSVSFGTATLYSTTGRRELVDDAESSLARARTERAVT